MTDWMKSVQSKGRGFRPGLTVGHGVNGKVVIDVESDDFKPWRVTAIPHYVEYLDLETGETSWEKFDRMPRMSVLYLARMVVRKNENGTYEYMKNRETGELRQLTDKEVMWLLLKAGG